MRSRSALRCGRVAAVALLLFLALGAADLAFTGWRYRGAIAALADAVPEETAYMRRAAAAGRPPKRRIWTPLDSVPPIAVCAVLAAEDYAFFKHGPIDPVMQRRIVAHLLRGDFAYGGSTITQQLARNLFLGSERTPRRKLREYALAYGLSRTLSKERQLELYLNLVEWGPRVWGIGAASRHWFGKSPTSLTPTEAVLLATILPSPHRGLGQAAWATALPLKKRIVSRLWSATLLDGLTRSATVARIERWAAHAGTGRTPAEVRMLVDQELGPEPSAEDAAMARHPWSRRCDPKRSSPGRPAAKTRSLEL